MRHRELARLATVTLGLAATLGTSGALSQDAPPKGKTAENKVVDGPIEAEKRQVAPSKPKAAVRTLSVDPTAAARPAFRFRLLPRNSDRTPGDAAPIYLRIRHGLESDEFRAIEDRHFAWMDMPLSEFPTAEARKFVDGWRTRTDLLRFAARRQTCDWSYTVPEQRERIIELIMPDAQDMRNWARLLAIKARVEVAEKNFGSAIDTLETGFSFARDVSRGPFAVNFLIGAAIAHVMLDRLEELIAQPGAPNLYWALTALPRPLVSARDALELEQKFGENLVPEIADLESTRTDAEWSSLLARLYERMSSLAKSLRDVGETHWRLPGSSFAEFKAELLPKAREFLAAQGGKARDRTSDDQAIVLMIGHDYQDLRDEWFKPQYLPYPQIAPLVDEAQKRWFTAKLGQTPIFAAFVPAAAAVLLSEASLDRRVAAVRVIEAMRMHAQANGGALPRTLDEIKLVPVPPDPVTGKAFEYRLEGDVAILQGSVPPPPPLGLSYRISVRK